MAYEQIENHTHIQLRDFYAGWFPGKNHNDIPGVIGERGPIGSPDCNAVAWYRGALRKQFGYSAITTSALNSGASVNSLFYSQIMDEVVGNVGDKLYSELDTSTPVDITGSVVVDSSALVSWTEFKFGATEFLIGMDGINPPWKWVSGNAVVLGGSPPTGPYGVMWQNSMWIVEGEKLKFSAIGDPETWDANDNYVFDAPITGLGRLNRQLVVFFEDHIGILSGENNRLLIKEGRFIDGVGCSGHFTITNSKLNDQDILMFHAFDGLYAYNGSQNIIKLSKPIDNKYEAGSGVSTWNGTKFSKAVAAYDYRFDWAVMGLANASGVDNDFLLLSDTSRYYQLEEGGAIPHWPFKDLNKPLTSICFTRTISKLGDMIFGSNDGKVYKFDPALYTINGAAYPAEYKTKIFDLVTSYLVQEYNVLSESLGSTSLTVYLNDSLEIGDGNLDIINLDEGSDLLDFTFVMDESQLGGKEYLLRNVGVTGYGRFLQMKVANGSAGEQVILIGLDFILNSIGLETNVGN